MKFRYSLCLILLVLCSPLTWADNTNDPYESYNRKMFQFNDKVDQYVFTPIARTYRVVTPKPARSAIRNFFDNLRDIKSFGSNVLRGNVRNAGYDFMRVAINTTFGLGGLINIADEAGMPNNKNTLGDTFASWGWKNSNYLVLPLLGPTTVRDGLGNAITSVYSVDRALFHDSTLRYSLVGTNAIDQREGLLDTTDTLNQMALDKYILTRDGYIAFRNEQLGYSSDEFEELVDPEATTSFVETERNDTVQTQKQEHTQAIHTQMNTEDTLQPDVVEDELLIPSDDNTDALILMMPLIP